MIIGISYNVFDGEEFLQQNIDHLREYVDHISVVYQTISNLGNESKTIEQTVKSLKGVDTIERYEPKKGIPQQHELNKRNIGLSIAKEARCTHFMTMDVDEFYTKEDFQYMIDTIDDYESSACQMSTYYKTPEYRLEPKETYYCPLLYRIDRKCEFVRDDPFPVLVDPNKIIKSKDCIIFNRDEVEQHHLSYVRKDIVTKMNNSVGDLEEEDIKKVIKHFNNWKPGDKGLLPDNRYYNLVKTNEILNNN